MIELRELDLKEPDEIYRMIEEIGEGQNGFINGLLSTTKKEFQEKLIRNFEMSRGINLAEGVVPQTIYWFYAGRVPVGYGKLRHRLNERLLEYGGHIGYIIRPTERNKRYGTVALRELVKEAALKGINEILLTCNEDNIVSRKIIESNHGVLSGLREGTCKYWIRGSS